MADTIQVDFEAERVTVDFGGDTGYDNESNLVLGAICYLVQKWQTLPEGETDLSFALQVIEENLIDSQP